MFATRVTIFDRGPTKFIVFENAIALYRDMAQTIVSRIGHIVVAPWLFFRIKSDEYTLGSQSVLPPPSNAVVTKG